MSQDINPPAVPEGQGEVRILAIDGKSRGPSVDKSVTHLVEVGPLKIGDVIPDYWLHEESGIWTTCECAGAIHLPEGGDANWCRRARVATKNEIATYESGDSVSGSTETRCKHCGHWAENHQGALRFCRGGFGLAYEPASPTPAIERGEEGGPFDEELFFGWSTLTGHEFFASEEKAAEWAQNILDDSHPGGVWEDDVESLCYGKIIARAKQVNREDSEDGYACDYQMEDVIQPTPTTSAGQGALSDGTEADDADWLKGYMKYLLWAGVGCQTEHERLVRIADELTRLRTVIAGKDKEIERLRGEVERLTGAIAKTESEVQQILGKVLGYPWFKDDQANWPGSTEEHGVCVGDHVAATLVEEAVRALTTLTADLGRAREENERLARYIGRTADGVLLCDAKTAWCPRCKRVMQDRDSFGAWCDVCPDEGDKPNRAWFAWDETLGVDPASLRPAAKDETGGGE